MGDLQVMDLAVASPATVSRCGMVYMDAGQVGWRPLTLSWLHTLPQPLQGAPSEHLLALFDWLVPVSLRWLRREATEASPTLDGNLVTSLQRIVSAVAAPLAAAVEGGLAPLEAARRCEGVFLFALVWSIGASAATAAGRKLFDVFFRAAATGELACALSALSVMRAWSHGVRCESRAVWGRAAQAVAVQLAGRHMFSGCCFWA